MKHTKYLLVMLVALAISIPVGMTALASDDDPGESPEVSESESPEASGSEAPGASKSPSASATPDDDEDEDESPSVSPRASSTPDDDEDEDDEVTSSSTPKARETMKPSKTPEQEDEDEDEEEPEESGRPEKTPRVSVPPELEDDVDEYLDEDDDITEVEIDEEEGSVEVKYKLRARLFGFIDVPYELQARVEAKEGEVQVEAKGPWWLLFATDNADEVQDALAADPTLTDATNQGTVLSAIIGILKSLAGK